MMKKNSVVWFALGVLFLVAGCAPQQPRPAAASPGGAPTVDLTGVWQGYREWGGGNTTPITLRLKQTGANVSGTAEWRGVGDGGSETGGPVEGSVSGTHFTFAVPSVSYRGDTTVTTDTMNGFLDGTKSYRIHLRREK